MTEVTDAELDAVIDELFQFSRPGSVEELPDIEPVGFRYQVFFKGTLMARCVTRESAGRIRAVLLKLPRTKPQASI
jgi:hypothetical protein